MEKRIHKRKPTTRRQVLKNRTVVLSLIRVYLCSSVVKKISKPGLGGTGKFPGPAAPREAHGAGVQGLVRQNKPRLLLRRQAVFDQRQVQVFIAAVKFVADNRMAEMARWRRS